MFGALYIILITVSRYSVAILFGAITCLAGFLGVMLGTESARRLRVYTPRSDTFVCAFGLIMCAPFLYLALVFSSYSTALTWVTNYKINNNTIIKIIIELWYVRK